jgi:hypothetical protein
VTAALLLAHHSFGHWFVDIALYLGPVLVAAVLLFVWHRRDSRGEGGGGDDGSPHGLGSPPSDAEDRS